MHVVVEPLRDKLEYVNVRIIPARQAEHPCNISVRLIHPIHGASMYPEDMTFRMLISESIAVFDSDLGFPARHVSKMLTLITKQTHPTPPMPASATHLRTSNCLLISKIISSRPMNFESFSNGTPKYAVCDRDIRLDRSADIKTRIRIVK